MRSMGEVRWVMAFFDPHTISVIDTTSPPRCYAACNQAA